MLVQAIGSERGFLNIFFGSEARAVLLTLFSFRMSRRDL
jgi:hypothetical protein